ncbi:hypothetical protein B1R32_1084 [Abditibacterium utsteinense]|uniref:BON domain-containing protein n=1 Tax=Abditibacterium utsteinense TaxID=1960156 RepID=A0A2S8SSL8_9BACT|nr:BON domain-containing protein [Abditibacterium utsteinense]PQV63800.1 hypothetical protein B1R32_1084 [Abditibacterium utsteinense]
MQKLTVVVALSFFVASLAPAQAGSPFAKEREKQAADKAREREEKAKEKENKPAPNPRPEPQPERPKPDKGRDDHPYNHNNHDGDRDRDHHKDRDDWKRPRTVIIERPVYIPTFPPSYDPYNPYEAQARREDALLEAVAKQMRFALRENPILKPFKLDTDTVGDSVEIEGTVDTLEQMQLALDVARNIDPRTRIVITHIKIRQK